MDKIKSYIKLMRVHHYIKNVLIFLPIIFSKNIFNFGMMRNTVLGAIAFSLMASMVYIINDIIDVEEDRKHIKKKNRPIASGKVSIKEAWILVIVLLVISTLINIVLIKTSEQIGRWTLVIFYGYLIMNILYSVKLKYIPILDITILTLGFLLRVIYGSQIIGVGTSNWLYLTVLAVSFYMGLGKRRNELIKNGSQGRKVLKHYNKEFLDRNMYMCISLGIVFYSLWCIDINAAINGFINIIYTVPLVIVICMKYSLIVEGDSLGDPVDVILSDKILMLLILVYALLVFSIIFF